MIFTALRGIVTTPAGPVIVHQGQTLPARVSEAEITKLRRLGAALTPEELAAASEAAVLAAASAPPFSPAPGAAPPSPISPVPAPVLPALPPGPIELPLADRDASALADWITAERPSATRVIELAGASAELADRLLAAERVATNGSPRANVVKALESVIEKATA